MGLLNFFKSVSEIHKTPFPITIIINPNVLTMAPPDNLQTQLDKTNKPLN